MNRMRHRGTVLLVWTALLLPAVGAEQQARQVKEDPAKPKQIAESATARAGVRYASLDRRDPFLSPLGTKKGRKADDEEEPRGPVPPGMGGMFISQIALLGIAGQNDKMTAVFRGTDSRAYFLHEGDRFFDGSLTRIRSDFVTLTRETKYRSGKIVKEAVTKRLRPQ